MTTPDPGGRGAGPDQGRRTLLSWFLGTSVGALAVAILYPVVRFLSPPEVPEATTSQVEAGAVNDPELVDKGYKIVRFGGQPVIVIKVSDTDVRAFSAVCTHLGCIVQYEKDKARIWCACHGGVYDLSGRNVSGPPPRPLEAYQVHLLEQGSQQPEKIVVQKS